MELWGSIVGGLSSKTQNKLEGLASEISSTFRYCNALQIPWRLYTVEFRAHSGVNLHSLLFYDPHKMYKVRSTRVTIRSATLPSVVVQ